MAASMRRSAPMEPEASTHEHDEVGGAGLPDGLAEIGPLDRTRDAGLRPGRAVRSGPPGGRRPPARWRPTAMSVTPSGDGRAATIPPRSAGPRLRRPRTPDGRCVFSASEHARAPGRRAARPAPSLRAGRLRRSPVVARSPVGVVGVGVARSAGSAARRASRRGRRRAPRARGRGRRAGPGGGGGPGPGAPGGRRRRRWPPCGRRGRPAAAAPRARTRSARRPSASSSAQSRLVSASTSSGTTTSPRMGGGVRRWRPAAPPRRRRTARRRRRGRRRRPAGGGRPRSAARGSRGARTSTASPNRSRSWGRSSPSSGFIDPTSTNRQGARR